MAARLAPHPPAETLRAFSSGQLDHATARTVAAHLDACPACRAAVAGMSDDGLLKRIRAAQPMPDPEAQSRSSSASHDRTPPPPGLPTTIHYAAPARSDQKQAAHDQKATMDSTVVPELRNHPQYEVLRELGRGGMGIVYLAKNKLMRRLEVLKVVNRQLLEDPDMVARFLREISSAANLNHPNIVIAYAALQSGDLLAFAMEYVQGEDLAKVVLGRGELPVASACYYAQQAALGLQHACDKGMVHRDIKPQNLILAQDGGKEVVKILDFGLAKATCEKAGASHSLLEAHRKLTKLGMVIGTPQYIAPEQIMDAARADIRADIYSLGCTLYFLLTRRVPFQTKSLDELLEAHYRMEATPLYKVRAEVPAELSAIVGRMMAKNPAKRYQTPAEVASALAPFVRSGQRPLPMEGTKADAKADAKREAVRPAAALAPRITNTLIEDDVAVAPPLRTRLAPPGGRRAAKRFKVGALAIFGLLFVVAGFTLIAGVIALWASGVIHGDTPPGDVAGGNKEPKSSSTEKTKGDASNLTEGPVHFGPEGPKAVLTYRCKDEFFVRVYNLTTGKALSPPLNGSTGGRFSPDGKRIVTVSVDHGARVFDVATGKDLTQPFMRTDSIGCVEYASFSADGKRIVTWGYSQARIWDAVTGRPLTPSLEHDHAVSSASLSPDGKRLVTTSSSSNWRARVWDASTGKDLTPPLLRSGGSDGHSAAFSPDGKRIVIASGNSAEVRDLATGEAVTPLLKHKEKQNVYCAYFGPDGKSVLTASSDGTARVWDAATGNTLTPALKHNGAVLMASFSRDGNWVVTASSDGTARVWDAATGEALTPALQHYYYVRQASFSPDGKQVITVSGGVDAAGYKELDSTTAQVWDVKTGKELKRATITAD